MDKLLEFIESKIKQAEKEARKAKVDNLERFIENKRKICWEAEYQDGEYCIGENEVRKFFKLEAQ